MKTEEIINSIALVGIGSILKGLFDFFAAIRKSKQDAKQLTKETRYKAIILLCYSLVNYEKEEVNLIINRPDINSRERLLNEIIAEFINMSLYASDKVVLSMNKFIKNTTKETLGELAFSMRKDLYGIKTSLKSNHFEF